MQKSLLRSIFKKNLFKTSYLCKTAYYNIFLKNSLFETAYLCKRTYYDLF